MKFTIERLKYIALTFLGLLLLFASSQVPSRQKKHENQIKLFKNLPLIATASMGHTEFGWIVAALEGLAKTINAWSAEDSTVLNPSKKELALKQFYHFYEHIDALAEAQIGMREVFTYPASYLAFEKNDLENALRIAELGAQDERLKPDLALVIAYLKHLFLTDLNSVADAYERVLEAYPQALWLNETIQKL
ncbi:MAG: hypothetical protein RJB13_1711, partial [Pseudomonadota bacterium]